MCIRDRTRTSPATGRPLHASSWSPPPPSMPRCSPRSRETAPLTAAALHGTARLTGGTGKNDQIARAEVAGRNLARPWTRPTSISARPVFRTVIGHAPCVDGQECLWLNGSVGPGLIAETDVLLSLIHISEPTRPY